MARQACSVVRAPSKLPTNSSASSIGNATPNPAVPVPTPVSPPAATRKAPPDCTTVASTVSPASSQRPSSPTSGEKKSAVYSAVAVLRETRRRPSSGLNVRIGLWVPSFEKIRAAVHAGGNVGERANPRIPPSAFGR